MRPLPACRNVVTELASFTASFLVQLVQTQHMLLAAPTVVLLQEAPVLVWCRPLFHNDTTLRLRGGGLLRSCRINCSLGWGSRCTIRRGGGPRRFDPWVRGVWLVYRRVTHPLPRKGLASAPISLLFWGKGGEGEGRRGRGGRRGGGGGGEGGEGGGWAGSRGGIRSTAMRRGPRRRTGGAAGRMPGAPRLPLPSRERYN